MTGSVQERQFAFKNFTQGEPGTQILTKNAKA